MSTFRTNGEEVAENEIVVDFDNQNALNNTRTNELLDIEENKFD